MTFGLQAQIGTCHDLKLFISPPEPHRVSSDDLWCFKSLQRDNSEVFLITVDPGLDEEPHKQFKNSLRINNINYNGLEHNNHNMGLKIKF